MQSLNERLVAHRQGNSSSRRQKSVFKTILVPSIVLVIIEVLLLMAVLTANQILERFNRNYEDLVTKQIQNRADYFASALYNWSDLDALAGTINSKAEDMLESGEINLDELESNSEVSSPLVMAIVDDLVSTMYSKRLSGIYVVFNTSDISNIPKMKTIPDRTGIYIRDMDPSSAPSERMDDLLLCRAAVQVVQQLNISTDSCWKPRFTFSDKDTPENYAYFSEPMLAAQKADVINDAKDYGYWGGAEHLLVDSDMTAITYSIPLVLSDGTVYGVLGIDIADDYLLSQLPYTELYDNDVGAYFVIKQKSDYNSLKIVTPILWNGESFDHDHDISLSLTKSHDGYTFVNHGKKYFAAAVPISLYSNNSPFESDYWAILGAVPTEDLYEFSSRILIMLLLDVALMLITGIVMSIIISRSISAPIHKLSGEISEARKAGGIPDLSATDIREIDSFADDFTSLCKEVVSTSTRFLQIIQLASVELAGFEVRKDLNTVFVTDNFFSLFGINDVNADDITVERFEEIILRIKRSFPGSVGPDGGMVYKVEPTPGTIRYIRINVTATATGRVGVAEDVTMVTMEKLLIQHERDCDALTGLMSRRAFYERAQELFSDPDKMYNGALVMLDLDNLKTINDHYGHDYGDKYIHQAAARFAECAPADAICSRVSGDEFFVLFYGYKDYELLRDAVYSFAMGIKINIFELPNGEKIPISASGGVAFYPKDSSDFWQLMKFADFAMYKAKHVRKGTIEYFDLSAYSRESFLISSRQDFLKLILEKRVYYHFQPIFSADDGSIYAYEALMRTDLPSLSPASVLEIARDENRLQDIENLTWIKAPEYYMELVEANKVEKNALLFVNSFASQIMSPWAQKIYDSKFSHLNNMIVIEITEYVDLEPGILERKKHLAGSNGLFALDDFGSGYNSELNLLEISPQYIKVDISIIRNIDVDPDKQKIVSNIVSYAHERNVKIIAEGIETAAELTTALELGVDLLQGFILARPAAVPNNISKDALDIIKDFRTQKGNAC